VTLQQGPHLNPSPKQALLLRWHVAVKPVDLPLQRPLVTALARASAAQDPTPSVMQALAGLSTESGPGSNGSASSQHLPLLQSLPEESRSFGSGRGWMLWAPLHRLRAITETDWRRVCHCDGRER